MIIAVDGPAASGKGTLARRLAGHYGLRHLDTGQLYRAVAWHVLDVGGDLEDEAAGLAAVEALKTKMPDDSQLRPAGIGEAASVVSAIAAVRAELLAYQRAFAAEPPGAVLDGRDIGTIVCPDADVKLFVTASSAKRAKRRWCELTGNGEAVSLDTILDDIIRRDERDRNRDVSPLRPAEDAHLLDTTDLDIEAAFQAAVDLIDGA